MVKANPALKTLALAAIFAGILVPFEPAQAASGAKLPTFHDFVLSVTTGQFGVVTGIYVPDVFAFPVVAQPAGNPAFVSTNDGVITQFGPAEQNDVIGLLAHNNLAGATFSNLQVGQEIRVVYGDGKYTSFWVNEIDRFQALSPTDVYSNFYDSASGQTYSTQQIYDRFYSGGNHVTLQTCIASGGESSWGRLFITATPQRLSLAPIFGNLNILFKAWRGHAAVSN